MNIFQFPILNITYNFKNLKNIEMFNFHIKGRTTTGIKHSFAKILHSFMRKVSKRRTLARY